MVLGGCRSFLLLVTTSRDHLKVIPFPTLDGNNKKLIT